MYEQLAILAVFVFLYSILSGRLERGVISGPMIFVAAGFVMGPAVLGWFSGEEPNQSLRLLADLTLALFLFTDSANANLRTLEHNYGIPLRMLLIGLPGAIALGFLFAFVMFDALTIFEAAVLGTILAATDAALGKAVITNKRVPSRLREGLNVESGLNDGLCVPILFVFIALELGGEEGLASGLVLRLLAMELGIGLFVGVSLAALGGMLLRFCRRQGWVTEDWAQITSVALALACFSVAQSLEGSGYIAAFAGGMIFGIIAKERTHQLVEPAEGIGNTLALLTWMLFGVAIVGQVIEQWTWQVFIYSMFSLTVVRMLPVYISLTGTSESNSNKLFLGWFGPRGLASIVFTVIVMDSGLPGAVLMAQVVVCTVLISLVLHGVSANPLAKRFAAQDAPAQKR